MLRQGRVSLAEALLSQPERAPDRAPVLPARCVRIDVALGEVPPEIFGQALRVNVPQALRVGRARRGSDVRAAVAKARDARRLVAASGRAQRGLGHDWTRRA